MAGYFHGLFEGPVKPDPREVSDYRLSDASTLDCELAADTSIFTPWFNQEWAVIRRQCWDRVMSLVAQRG
jgi:isopentenyldiphosphate isomerase